MALSVPRPTIKQQGASGAALSSEKPITLTCAPVTFADGSPIEAGQETRAAFVLYRQPAGAALQAWNPQARAWQAPDPTPEGDPLVVRDGAWTGVLVAIGRKDAADNPMFDPAAAAAYSVACSFAATDASGAAQSGASPRSSGFTVVWPGDDYRGGIEIKPEDPAQATHLEMFLRDSPVRDRAFVSLDGDGDIYSVTIMAEGAVIELSGDGITLTPASGTSVHVEGSLEVSGLLSCGRLASP